MKSFKKIAAAALALVMCLGNATTAFAATPDDATIDESRKGSLTIYKYDVTNAEKDGVWDSSYVSTGTMDQSGVVDVLGGDGQSTLGNGEAAYKYAIKGVEFTYLKVADVIQYSDAASDYVKTLYSVDKTAGKAFLTALGLDGSESFANAAQLDSGKFFFDSDTIINALSAALSKNSTTVKNALESYVTSNGGSKMPLTDSYGKTSATNLDLGLYLIVETKVPEMVVSTVDPFLVTLPMTTVNGTNATNGGEAWNYDVVLFPKNLTGIPSLEKTLREQVSDTGKNGGSASDIKDGYAHTGTASDGDTIDYQIISTLPSITSESTYLSAYTFIDTLTKGLSYNKKDVKLQFFSDAACNNLVATWTEADGKFAVSYNTKDTGESVMTIEMTAQGLSEINTSKAVYSADTMLNSGYSDCTLRITYQATMHSDKSVTYGDAGNPNDVVLLWKRTSQDYYDTLVDDCHVYTYGIDLTKTFSDGKGDYSKVQFTIQNQTDNYYVKAELNKDDGVYYVTDHVEKKDATRFTPVAGENKGSIIIKGLEDDEYIITEVKTDNGYTLLKNTISVVISRKDTTDLCSIYGTDVLGLIQNDPRYATIIKDTGSLKNMPQKHLEHHLLTASSTVDSKAVTMLKDGSSNNAEAPLTVVNTPGFDLPQTGDHGTWMFSIGGLLLMAVSAGAIYVLTRKKKARR